MINHQSPVPPSIRLNGVKAIDGMNIKFNADMKNDTHVLQHAWHLNNSAKLSEIELAKLRIYSKILKGPLKYINIFTNE